MNNKWSCNNNFFQNVVGWEYEGKVDKHASQKGTISQINVYFLQALIEGVYATCKKSHFQLNYVAFIFFTCKLGKWEFDNNYTDLAKAKRN